MCSTGKFNATAYGLYRHEPRHHKAADHLQDGTHSNADIHHNLHPAVGIILSLEEGAIPPPVKHHVGKPQGKQQNSQNLMNPVVWEKDSSSHKDYGEDCHHEIYVPLQCYSLSLFSTRKTISGISTSCRTMPGRTRGMLVQMLIGSIFSFPRR